MGGLALGLIVVVGIILGIVAQLIGVARSGYDGLITGIAIVGGRLLRGNGSAECLPGGRRSMACSCCRRL